MKSVSPNAKLVLHVTGLPFQAPAYSMAKAYFRFMTEQGVPLDIAGISHPYADFPWTLNKSSTDCWMQQIQELSDYNAALGKKTLIAEASYPRQPGAYSEPFIEFPYSDAGQAAFVRQHLRHGNNNNANMAGFLVLLRRLLPRHVRRRIGRGQPRETRPALSGLHGYTGPAGVRKRHCCEVRLRESESLCS